METTCLNNLYELLSDLQELDDKECSLLLEQYNIKIVKVQHEFMAYFGINIGLSGIGHLRITALKSLLVRYNVPLDNKEGLEKAMRTVFK